MTDNKDKNKQAIEEYKKSVKQAESGGKANAKSPTSSATGLYQFTEATWKEMQKKLGKKLDIFNVKDQEEAMNKLTEINIQALEKNGLPVTAQNLYMTHFLGMSGGPKFLKNLQKNPNELASKYVSDSAVNANKNLFYKDNQPVTAAELYNDLSSRLGIQEQTQQTQPQVIDLQPEFNETIIESTSTAKPRIDNNIKHTNPKQVTDNQHNISPVDNNRVNLGFTEDLDFLPKDINLAFTQEEQLQEELNNPEELINIARNGGEQITLADANTSRQVLNEFNEGGSHEENKYNGIPQGIGPNGKLNTVEEGETKFNNYIFSDTLIVNENDAESLFLPPQIIGKTFAEASKYINSFLEDNPNDLIIRKTAEKQLDALTLGNEKAKLAKEKLDVNLGTPDNTEIINNEMFLGGDTPDASIVSPNNILGLATGGLGLLDQAQGNTSSDPLGAGLTGAASGFMAGSSLGPLGSAIGGAVGLGAGLIGSVKARKEEREMNRKKHIRNSGLYQNDFATGGDLKDPKYIPDVNDPFLSEIGFGDTITSQDNYNVPTINETDFNLDNPIWGTELLSDFTPTESSNTNKNRSPQRGKNYLQYAPVLGDFLNYRDARNDSPDVENLNNINRRFIPDYVDEASIQNIVNNDFDNMLNSLSNTTNGSIGALRNATLAAGANRTKALSDAYFRTGEANRQQNLMGQQFDLGIDQFNIGQDNLERDINARNEAAVEDRQRASRDAIFRDLGAIGREQTYDNRLYNLTGGYDSMGFYNPENISFLDQLGLNPNQNKMGGFLSTAYSASQSSKTKKLEEEFNKRYK